ncbi:MAG: tripartite tricarboxylate transporter substrate binding protein [Betaproteobacteria bacterium]|jgi:tripartite-type tricarboxylate transporter receptor subunit TctC
MKKAFLKIIPLLSAFFMGLAPFLYAQAQDFPSKPIRIIVGQGAGGGVDMMTRVIAQKLSANLNQSVIVENKAGAGGIIATEFVAKSNPDGYNLLMAPSGNMVFTPILMPKLKYSPTKDFTPISMIANFPLILLVNTKVPIQNVQDLVSFMKANPNKSNYGGSGPLFQFSSELFKIKTGTPGEFIQFKSTTESINAMMSGDLLMTFSDPGPALPALQTGNVRALAVTAPTRLPSLPNIPTMAEVGMSGVEFKVWTALFAPTGTPANIVKFLETEVNKVLRQADVIQAMNIMSVQASGTTSEEFSKILKEDLLKWGQVAETAKISLPTP